MKKNKKIKIGVVDYKKKLSSYRRRFIYFLNKKNFLIEDAKIEKYYDYVFLNELADLSKWVKYDKSKIIFDLVNPYLLEKNFILKNFRGSFKFLVGDHEYLFFSYNKLLHAMIRKSYYTVTTSHRQLIEIKKINKYSEVIYDFFFEIKPRIKNNNRRKKKELSIVWEGQPEQVVNWFYIKNAIHDLAKEYKISMNIITKKYYFLISKRYIKKSVYSFFKKNFPNQNIKIYDWNFQNLRNICYYSDIAVIPIDSQRKTWLSKSSNKLLFFMYMGMPVMASNTYDYKLVLKKLGINSYFDNESDFIKKIKKLYLLNNDSKNIVNKKDFNKIYSEKKLLDQWSNILKQKKKF